MVSHLGAPRARVAGPIVGLAGVVLLALALAGPALADAAPPLKPPCGDLAPMGETQVQMAAETVLLEVAAPAAVHVRAEFTLRNQGAAEERLAVRFPLEDPSGMGDGYGKFPEVQNLAVVAGNGTLAWRSVAEPFREGDPPIHWATFDMVFPPGQDVLLVVSYETALTGYGPGKGRASLYYVLETGAGWYGPIGRADLIVRLPYPAGPENVLAASRAPSGLSFVDGEARCHWESLEPTHEDNFWLSLVWPEDWQRVLAAREALSGRPGDAQAAIDLAEAYRIAGSDSKGFATEPLAGLAQATVEQALARTPGAANLHAELANILVWRLPYGGALSDPSLPRIRDELAHALAIDPQNSLALQVQSELRARLGPEALLEPSPTLSRPERQATQEAKDASAHPTVPATGAATPIPSLVPASAPTPARSSPSAASGWVYLVLLPSIALALVAYVALRRRR